MTELSPVGTTTTEEFGGFNKMGAAGIVVPGTEGKITCTKTGEDLPHTEEGEICIRGPQMMKGYLNNQKATDDMITKDGWLKSGDIGFFDKDGLLFVTDRLKELIKYKGFQVAPAELEALIATLPQVKDVIVIPVLDDEAGELPRAYVVKQDGMEITEQEVKDFVASRLVSHKKLRGGVIFVESVPKSPSGKLLRRTQIALDRAQ